MIEIDKTGNYTVTIKADLMDGKLTIPYTPALGQLRNGMVELTVKNWSSKRTPNQNKLFWLWVRLIADYTGYTPMQVKTILQYKFLFMYEFCDVTGGLLPRIRSTAELNKKEFTEFMDNINQWAGEYLQLQLPNT